MLENVAVEDLLADVVQHGEAHHNVPRRGRVAPLARPDQVRVVDGGGHDLVVVHVEMEGVHATVAAPHEEQLVHVPQAHALQRHVRVPHDVVDAVAPGEGERADAANGHRHLGVREIVEVRGQRRLPLPPLPAEGQGREPRGPGGGGGEHEVEHARLLVLVPQPLGIIGRRGVHGHHGALGAAAQHPHVTARTRHAHHVRQRQVRRVPIWKTPSLA
mmetsp:Transcript_9086/g.30985  ORF Transcript_9086/g.30985 Transcript_9086/m.30985 type:complete len:216 (+) Transcript_9086:228-875(+)